MTGIDMKTKQNTHTNNNNHNNTTTNKNHVRSITMISTWYAPIRRIARLITNLGYIYN